MKRPELDVLLRRRVQGYTSNQKFQIAYGLIRDRGSWRLLNCVINFLGPTNRESLDYLYGDQVALVREIVPSGLAGRIREIIDANSFHVGKFSLSEGLTVTDHIGHEESGRETRPTEDEELTTATFHPQKLGIEFWLRPIKEDRPRVLTIQT